MPGPAPRHGGRRQRKRAVDLTLVTGGDRGVPAVPKGLLKRTREQWESFWRSPVATVVSLDTDLPSLERLFSLYDERERAYRAVCKERLVVGSQGQPVLNPLARQLCSYDAEIRQLEDRFGLTPMARLRLGVQIGTAARTLDDLNRQLDHDDQDKTEDPRLQVIEG